MKKHIYAVCAYKESPYLEECIQSIRGQSVPSDILVSTSTPNAHIERICKKYDVPLYLNEGESGITQDWNFAYKMADAELVTIAHQDDLYLPNYTREIMGMAERVKKPLILFTDYAELRNGEMVKKNKLLKVKRMMLYPLRFKCFWNSRFVRRRILSLGSPIACPAVTYAKENLPETVFKAGFRSCEDWEAWEMLSKRKGAFAYTKEIGMCHRIHEESETSIILGDNARREEDFTMFCKFWPKPVARILAKVYSTSEKSNEL